MSKPRSAIADYAVYVVVRIVVCVIQALPDVCALGFARGLAWLAYHVDRRHRLVAAENLRLAFPERYEPAELERMIRSIYIHFCRLIVEITMIPRKLHTNTWRRYIDLPQGRQLVQCLLSGRPLLLVTGHFGNWEMGGYVLGLLGFHTHAIARPIDNPHIDRFLRRFRERTGQKLLAKKGDFDQIQQILDRGGVLATLGDQDAGQRGLFINFFGRPASTHKAIALLAIEHHVPMLVIGVERTGEPMRYSIRVMDTILPEDYAARSDAVKAMTQRYTTALENAVRAAPEQYFWLHRRWKHQPAKARKQAA